MTGLQGCFALFLKKFVFHRDAQQVVDRQMVFLDFVGFQLRGGNHDIAEVLHAALAVANKTDGFDAQGFCQLHGIDDVGGVAGGATAATRIRRLDEHAQITVFVRSGYISYANCGLPYYIGEVIEDPEELT